MLKRLFDKVMWMGRATSALVGLVVLFALAIGAANSALAHTTVDNKLFHLGHINPVQAISTLTGTLTGAVLKLDNNGTGPALQLEVGERRAPLKVNALAGTATNLSADKLDGRDSSEFAHGEGGVADRALSADQATQAANADFLGGVSASGYQERVTSSCEVGSSIRVVNPDGTVACEADDGGGKAPDSELLDGKDSTQFANATHPHSGADITSGTVAEARIDGTVTRDSEVMPTVRANDRTGSGVDADTLDGKDSRAFSIRTDHATALAHECDTVGVLNECAPVTVTVPDGKRYIVSVWSSFSAKNSLNNTAYQFVRYCSAGKGPSIDANNPCITPFGHLNTVQMSDLLIAASSSGETLSLSPGTYTFFTAIKPDVFAFADVSTDRVITKVMVRDATNGL